MRTKFLTTLAMAALFTAGSAGLAAAQPVLSHRVDDQMVCPNSGHPEIYQRFLHPCADHAFAAPKAGVRDMAYSSNTSSRTNNATYIR